MSRPKNADSQRTHDAILSATRALIADADPNPGRVSMRAIAARADVSLSTLQYYFGCRGELLEACLDAYYERFQTMIAILSGKLADCAAADRRPELAREVTRTLFRFACQERDNLALRHALNVELGELPSRRRDHVQGPGLDRGAAVVSALFSCSPDRARMLLQTLVFAGAKYATLTEDELCLIVGDGSKQELEERVAEHLAELALGYLALGDPPSA